MALAGRCTDFEITHYDRPATVTISPIRDRQGKIVGTIGRIENSALSHTPSTPADAKTQIGDATNGTRPADAEATMASAGRDEAFQVLDERDSLHLQIENLRASVQAVLSSISDAALLLDADGNILFFNRQAAVLSPSLAKDRKISLAMLGPGEPWDTAREMLQGEKTDQDPPPYNAEDAASDQSWSLRMSKLAGAGEGPDVFVMTLRDTSELRHLRQTLKESVEMATLGSLLASAAHQTRSGLFGLSVILEAVRAHETDDSNTRIYFEKFREGIARLQSLVSDLLNYQKPDSATASVAALNVLLRRAVSGCKELALGRSVEIEFISSLDANIAGNAPRMVRAFESMLEFAIQQASPGAIVRVAIEPDGEGEGSTARCTISEASVCPRNQRMRQSPLRVFDRRSGGATGLSLAIARKIIEDHCGTITPADSTDVGVIVTVRLPVSPAVPPPEIPIESPAPTRRLLD